MLEAAGAGEFLLRAARLAELQLNAKLSADPDRWKECTSDLGLPDQNAIRPDLRPRL